MKILETKKYRHVSLLKVHRYIKYKELIKKEDSNIYDNIKLYVRIYVYMLFYRLYNAKKKYFHLLFVILILFVLNSLKDSNKNYEDYDVDIVEYNIDNVNELKESKIKNTFDYRNHLSNKAVNADLVGKDTYYGVTHSNKDSAIIGRIIRAYRFKNITYICEKKYGLPQNILLTLIINESTGIDLLPNSSDDGGFGLIHMQPIVAYDFGLKNIYNNSRKLIDNEQGVELRSRISDEILLNNNVEDRSDLCSFDDRLNNYMNIDCAARILKYHSIKALDGNADAIISDAIQGFAGKYRYLDYYNKVLNLLTLLNNDDYINNTVKVSFNNMNKHNGITFDQYMNEWWKYNENYNLEQ